MRKVKSISFTSEEDDLLQQFEKQTDKSDYVKSLIKKDIYNSEIPIEEKIEQMFKKYLS